MALILAAIAFVITIIFTVLVAIGDNTPAAPSALMPAFSPWDILLYGSVITFVIGAVHWFP